MPGQTGHDGETRQTPLSPEIIMAGLVPAIHVSPLPQLKNAQARA
jgi:hypothetical protein